MENSRFKNQQQAHVETSHNLFGNAQPLKNIVAAATQPTRAYAAKAARKQYVHDYARFKMKCFYTDGNTSVHYSYDFTHVYTNGAKERITDEETGLIKLMRYAYKVKDKCISAVIWCKVTDDTSTLVQTYNTEVVKYVKNRAPIIDKRITFVKGKFDYSAFTLKS